jgi:hypothetical protein
MSQQSINLGTADSGNGDPLRVAFAKVNNNFAELYSSVIATGVVNTSASPPVSPGEGDLWWDTNDGNLYVYYLGVWASANAGLQGPQGPQGPQGVEGPAGIRGLKGNTGDTGPRGFTGETGAQGNDGPRGLKGDQGDAGPAGTNGVAGEQGPQGDPGSQVQFSLTAPNPLTEGNVWWNMNDGNLYVHYNSQWVSAVSIAGLNSTNQLVNGAHTVSLGTDGKLTLPNGSTIGDGEAGVGVPITTARGTILLGNLAECAGGESHFHIMKAGQQAIDLFLGDDSNYVKLPDTGGVEISSSEIGAQHYWTFGADGNLTFPDATTSTGKDITIPVDQSLTVNLSYILPDIGVNTFKINPESIKLLTGNGIIYAGTETAANRWDLDSGNNVLRFPDAGDAVYPQINYSKDDNVTGMELITYAKSIKITAAQTSTWTFDNGGKLTLPADSSILTNETALNIATHSTATYTFDQAYWEALNGDVTRMYTFTGNAQYFSCTVTANQDGTYTVADTTGNSFDLLAGSWFKIPGDELGGATPANDIQITVATVDDGGAILTTTLTGTAVSKQWTFGEDGRTTFPVATVPAHSYGAAGDKAGMLAFDVDYIYYCTADYVNDTTDIWKRTAHGAGTW